MKVKVISRNPDEYLRETKLDIHKVKRNYDPALHPFAAAREYVRALNATKLERVFAKPFLGNLEGHQDGVVCFAKHPKSLSTIASGAYDGGICIWDLPTRECRRSFIAHEGYVRGIAYTPDCERFITVGDDKTVKTWSSTAPEDEDDEEPLKQFLSRTIITGISHHRYDPVFATCGETCHLWDENRSEPSATMQWNVDSLHDVKFNPIIADLLACCASDRSIILYDRREATPLRKVVMNLRPNRLSWNPMQAEIFTVANEDYSLYTFDARRIKYPIKIHKGHVSAVLDVDWSPTGQEFVSGSYDKTIRIFEAHKSSSREIYHTKRMQHVTCIAWSLDCRYIFSGSDEMNIRLWKARAAEKLGSLRPREKAAFRYNEALKKRFAAHPQVQRIARHRQVPKYVYNEAKNLREAINKIKRKEANRRANSRPGKVPIVPDLKKHTIKEEV